MKPFEIFSVAGITITTLLGFYNLFINIKSQRKTQRELIFNRQFEFFMQLQGLIVEFEDAVSEINENHTKLDDSRERIFKLSNNIDMLSSKNDLIIPNVMYSKICDYSSFCHEISSLSYNDPSKIDKKFKSDFIDTNFSLLDDLRAYIGIENLSEENRKLVKGRLLNG